MHFGKPVCKSYHPKSGLDNGVLTYIVRFAGVSLLVALTITVSPP